MEIHIGSIFVTMIITPLYKKVLAMSPIIIVGMHRSGTTLLSKILERSGVFIGFPQTKNGESIFFQSINKEALDMLGCSWRTTDFLPKTEELMANYKWLYRMIFRRVQKDLIFKFWGWKAIHLIAKSQSLWGWKDPRNSLLLPLWHAIFPKARVVNIYRDGRDVALSLLSREINREDRSAVFSKQEIEQRYVSNIRLWEIYVKRIQEALPLFENNYTIKYENLLSQPKKEMTNLFTELNIDLLVSIDRAVSIVDSSRTRRYSTNAFPFIKQKSMESPLLEKLGYT
jgi:hypothetical protein